MIDNQTLHFQTEKEPNINLWRWSLEDYHRLIESAIFEEDDPVELLEGYITVKMPKKPRHNMFVRLLFDLIRELLPEGMFIHTEGPITIAESDSEPEPDLLVIKGSPRDFLTSHPTPASVPLVIEVADSSLHKDQTLKQKVYANAGISTYWIVNLQANQIEVYASPGQNGRYQDLKTYEAEDAIPLIFNNEQIGIINLVSLFD